MNHLELTEKLAANSISTENWGSGTSKTLDHLMLELIAGESELLPTDEGLVRKEQGVGINVYFQNGDQLLRLVEIKQIFVDGRERVRNYPTSLGEKMRPGESVADAARRALKEELGINHPELLITDDVIYETEDRAPVTSESYPGLLTQRTIHVTSVHLPLKYFDPAGYQEVQPDKTTFFEWRRVEQTN